MTINDFKNKQAKEIMDNINKNNNNSFISIRQDDNFKTDKVIAIKDIHLYENHITTAGSKILENFKAPFSSTVVNLLEEAGFAIVGTTNMDEFAMGFTNDTSFRGGVENAVNSDYVAGGSSGGSAYAVAKGLVPVATGTDTGGSIRQPASFNGIYGLKPTYGIVSRYGTIPFASSFDTIGILSNNVIDNAQTMEVLAKQDPQDQTNFVPEGFEMTSLIGKDIKGLKVAYIKEWMDMVKEYPVYEKLEKQFKQLEEAGIILEEVSIPTVKYSFELYLALSYAEASSNLSRYDGIRYGLVNSTDDYSDYRHNLGFEVRKRLLIGAALTSSGNAHQYHEYALKIRTKMKNQFNKVFKEYSLIIGPIALGGALKKGEGLNEKEGYIYDQFLIPANLTGIPAMSVPMDEIDGMPVGLQIMADKYNEKVIYQLASFMENGGKND